MNDLMEVFGDPLFWVGIGLFVFSILGIVLILKAFQKETPESLLLPEKPKESMKEIPKSERTAQMQAVPIPSAVQRLEEKNLKAPATLDSISQRMEKLEKLLAEHSPPLKPGAERKEISEEVRDIQQSLKTQSPASDPSQIRELSAKLDKIYQILIDLSGPEK